jgi:predicted AAA+ superfamily ATPase
MWYKRFGYSFDPFLRDPLKAHYTAVSHEKLVRYLSAQLQSGHLCIVDGPQGFGKTTILKQLLSRLAKKIYYVDAQTLSSDIEHVLSSKLSLVRRIFEGKPKLILLLVDNADCLSAKNLEKIKYYFDQDYILGAVLAVTKLDKSRFSGGFLDRVSTIARIQPLHELESLRIVRERFTHQYFLPDETVLAIISHCKGNVCQLLNTCSAVCAKVAKAGKLEVTPKHVSEYVRSKSK